MVISKFLTCRTRNQESLLFPYFSLFTSPFFPLTIFTLVCPALCFNPWSQSSIRYYSLMMQEWLRGSCWKIHASLHFMVLTATRTDIYIFLNKILSRVLYDTIFFNPPSVIEEIKQSAHNPETWHACEDGKRRARHWSRFRSRFGTRCSWELLLHIERREMEHEVGNLITDP